MEIYEEQIIEIANRRIWKELLIPVVFMFATIMVLTWQCWVMKDRIEKLEGASPLSNAVGGRE